MKDIISRVDMRKVMHFEDGKTITFEKALANLGILIEKQNLSAAEVMETVASAITNLSIKLMRKEEIIGT